MARKHIKFLLILFTLMLISGVIIIYNSGKLENAPLKKAHKLSLQKKKDLTIRGFHLSGFHEGRKAITIKAAKFSVEKKKIGIFKFSPMRSARFRGAEVDLYLDHIQHSNGLPDQKEVVIKGLFSQETIPSSALKGASSIIFEPIIINFYLDDTNVTEIQARRATLDHRRRRVVLRGKIQATSASHQLSTERLTIYPEKGIIEVKDTFVLTTQSEKITGEKLTTDFFLKKRG